MALKVRTHRKWSKQDERMVREYYPVTPVKVLAILLTRTPRSVHDKARRLGVKYAVKKKVTNIAKPNKRVPFSEMEKDFITEFYFKTPNAKIAKLLNRSEGSIKNFALGKGLKKHPILWQNLRTIMPAIGKKKPLNQ